MGNKNLEVNVEVSKFDSNAYAKKMMFAEWFEKEVFNENDKTKFYQVLENDKKFQKDMEDWKAYLKSIGDKQEVSDTTKDTGLDWFWDSTQNQKEYVSSMTFDGFRTKRSHQPSLLTSKSMEVSGAV